MRAATLLSLAVAARLDNARGRYRDASAGLCRAFAGAGLAIGLLLARLARDFPFSG
jgi:hypothetical protein